MNSERHAKRRRVGRCDRKWATAAAAWPGVVALLAVAVGACGDGGSRRPTPRAVETDPQIATVVGRQTCASCHVEQEQRWRGSHHDLAMQRATSATVLGDFDNATYERGSESTRFFRRDEQFWVRTEGPTGNPEEYRVEFTFGVEPLQQYLLAFSGGRYQALDIAWDSRPESEGGQRWFHLRPGERYEPGDPLHWTGVAYTWNTMCAECHSTDLRKGYVAATDSYATVYAEVDVSCEACHGPGSEHVRWAEEWAARAPEGVTPAAREAGISADEMGLQVDFPRLVDHAWEIDPASGLARRIPDSAPAYDVELCGRCHARRGAIDDDYRHGEPLADFYRVALLENGLYHVDGQILDEVFVYGSFRQSLMYQQGVGCSDCHEPHGLQLYNRGNALCNRCHLGAKFDTPEHHHHEAGTSGAGCIDCHMPSTTYMVVDPRRDHSFRSPRPDLSLAYGVPNACAGCHAEEGDQWAADAVQRWFGSERKASYRELLAAGRSNRAGAEQDLRALANAAEAPAIARATALTELRPTTSASISSLAAALDDADPLVRSAALTALQSASPATVLRLAPPLLVDSSRLVRLAAARLMAAIPIQQVPPPQRAAVAAALEEYRDAQRVNEERAQAHLNLGWLALQQGDVATAEREYRTALRLEPQFIPTFVNLADLYRLTGRDADGEALLRRAVEIAPDSADVHHALGLLLVRRDRLDEAVTALARATRLAPDDPHYRYVYAVAVHTAGDPREAVRLLDEALDRFPDDAELLFGAAAYSRDLGEVERAIGYARRLVEVDPADPQAAALLRDLEARRER